MSEQPELMILHEHGFPDKRSVVPVVRRTKTQIVVRHGSTERRFMAASGDEVGSSGWIRTRLYEGTPDEITTVREDMQRRKLIARIQQTVWKSLTTTQLVAVVTVIGESADRQRTTEDG